MNQYMKYAINQLSNNKKHKYIWLFHAVKWC